MRLSDSDRLWKTLRIWLCCGMVRPRRPPRLWPRLRPALLALCLGACWQLAPATPARELTACISDLAFAPVSYPDREGRHQYLLREAAERLGLRIRFAVEPRQRCVESVAAGRYDWLAAAVDTPSLRARLAYPMNGQQVDVRRALTQLQVVFLAPVGGAASWDGQRLSGLRGPLLYRNGHLAARDWAAERGVEAFASVATVNMARMLLAGRAGLALLAGNEADALLAQPEFAGRLQRLQPPVFEAVLFAVASPAYLQTHRDEAEALWTAMSQQRQSAEFRRIERRFD